MNLKNLLHGLAEAVPDLEISEIYEDSRFVKPGGLFLSLKGQSGRVEDFAKEAQRRGALCVLSEEPLKLQIPNVTVKGLREKRDLIYKRFYSKLLKSHKFVGVTGTNGKTSVSFIISSILKEAKIKYSLIGTVLYDVVGQRLEADRTTPAAQMFFEILKRSYEKGGKILVTEVSSHALKQNRLPGVAFDVSVFTNLSRDHLDYHGTLEDYFLSKAKIADKTVGALILNEDDPWGLRLKLLSRARFSGKTVGVGKEGDVNLRILKVHRGGGVFSLNGRLFETNLVGAYNIYNCALAVQSALELGIDERLIDKALRKLKVPGRLEQVCENVFIDYAHTPDALEKVLKTLREVFKGKRLVAVFGCGGDRDRGKRALMGKIACTLADFCILTSDNPRFEEPETIISEIEKGFYRDNYRVIPDRRQAIREAVTEFSDAVILIAGKGHETYQEIKGRKFPFKDSEVVKEVLGETVKDS